MTRKEILLLVQKLGNTYRDNLGSLAIDFRETLYDVSILLDLDPKYLMRSLVLQRRKWKGVSKEASIYLDLALRLMSAEDETLRTMGAEPSDEDAIANGIRLLGSWASQTFQEGLIREFVNSVRPFAKKVQKAYPDLDSEEAVFFLLSELQERLVMSPTKFKDSGLLEDILQKVL